MPAPNPPTYQCRRDWRCEGRETVRDQLTGALLGWEPGRPAGNRADGLCGVCLDRFRAALRGLPMLLAELGAAIGRDQTSPAFDPAPRGGSPAPPIPLRGEIEAVRAWLIAETLTWADRVGDHCDRGLWAGVGERAHGPLEWPTGRLAGMPAGRRVIAAAELLARRHAVLLALPAEPTGVHSAGEHPADFADPDAVHVAGVDRGRSGIAPLAWALRDGVDAAATFLELQRRGGQVAGRTRVRERSSVGCTRCGWPTMTRYPGDSEWRCERCPYTRREDHQDVLRDALLRSRPATPRHR